MSLKIIGGIAKGTPLHVPKKTVVRPALSRMRAAIFSSLGDWIEGRNVLDLFAGSGSLGIEALSRGASFCTFVDLSKECIGCISNNLKKAHLEGKLILMDVFKFLQKNKEKYELIFASPPYIKASKPVDSSSLLSLVHQNIDSEGLFVWEFYSKNILRLPDFWSIHWEKTIGETKVWILKPLF
ncbi:N-6 DNA methylase [Methylacidiphilum sp. Yel]|jgi:16S rRNA (guanine966-N2)-methyltransferase|uniref:RsmD family RNA methyltransferase n=1 Tax=Methylacidiphilum sp. Yel TaxID=1847730 RepID=UPI001069F12B|nr:RsmD family RNA methyltransferase [Methylacidiphilum sp. Yel]TFE69378.1 N-6 DNA methylase [Methylacidiphilum sp. Yel]